MVGFITKIREEYPDKVIVAGNVVNKMTEELTVNGADVKLNRPFMCTTRTMTGVGVSPAQNVQMYQWRRWTHNGRWWLHTTRRYCKSIRYKSHGNDRRNVSRTR